MKNRKNKKRIFIPSLLFGGFLVMNRHKFPQLMFSLLCGVKPFGLIKKEEIKLDDHVKWFNDYYTINYIDGKTIAIGEPRYYQSNVNYLILGDKQALLLDTGPGIRNIKPVVESLTSLPITVMNSHFHYDHVGNHEKFSDIKLTENQIEKQIVKEDTLIPRKYSFVGQLEGFAPPKIKFKEILKEGTFIDLGNRQLEIIFTPGHSNDSISLYDKELNQLFVGDLIYHGPILAATLIPGVDIKKYLSSTKKLISKTNADTLLFGGHTLDVNHPSIQQHNLIDLKMFLERNERSRVLPKKQKINDKVDILY
ncbi:MBL fold metallo-hydrolase [Virgibacillus dokdonensis]